MAGKPDATTVFPQKLIVDYVRVYARTDVPRASLQILRTTGEFKALWPGEFPNAQLQRASGIGQPWQALPTTGARDGSVFAQPVAPGYYRLAWR